MILHCRERGYYRRRLVTRRTSNLYRIQNDRSPLACSASIVIDTAPWPAEAPNNRPLPFRHSDGIDRYPEVSHIRVAALSRRRVALLEDGINLEPKPELILAAQHLLQLLRGGNDPANLHLLGRASRKGSDRSYWSFT